MGYNRNLRKKLNVPNDMVLHHKDKDKTNNDPSNIEIMTKEEHDSIHAKERRGKRRGNKTEFININSTIYKTCTRCKNLKPITDFYILKRNGVKRGYHSYCKKCEIKYKFNWRMKKRSLKRTWLNFKEVQDGRSFLM